MGERLIRKCKKTQIKLQVFAEPIKRRKRGKARGPDILLRVQLRASAPDGPGPAQQGPLHQHQVLPPTSLSRDLHSPERIQELLSLPGH